MRLVQVFPYERQQREATRLGFALKYRIDPDERVIRVRLEARTPRAREAVSKAAEDERANGIESGATYSVAEDVIEKLGDVINHALEVARQTV